MEGRAWRWLLAVSAILCGLLPIPAAAAREGEGGFSSAQLLVVWDKRELSLQPARWCQPASRPSQTSLPCAADILLKFKAAIDNWEEVYASRDMSGWQAGAGLPVCLWSGVACDPVAGPGNRVTSL